jgi:acyl carrier protein
VTREAIRAQLTEYLTEMFEIPAEKVTFDALLVDDLDLDSIDTVDLLIKLQDLTGRRVTPEEFKSVRTVGDVIACIEKLLAEDVGSSI